MKKNQNKDNKNPQNTKKKAQGTIHIIPVKKNVPIKDNNSTIFNFFKITSLHKSTSTTTIHETRQTKLNDKKDKTESKKNYKLSKFDFYKSKKKNNNLFKKLTKNTEENENINKIDISKFILFNENFSKEINNIFTNNFIRSFKRYIDEKNKNEINNIGFSQKFNFSKNSFNKFIQQIFKNFINKYLLNTYHNLIYVPEINKNKQNDLNELIGLLSYNDKSDIFLEYSPINLSECNLFYPDLCKIISKFLKIFKIKKRRNIPNSALILYRPNEDFTAYINKIKLICSQLGYRTLIKEDEINKLMNIDKLKEINQNYIIGSLQDKNIKYLKILDNISITEKWTNFLESNNIQYQTNEEKTNKNQQKRQNNNNKSNISKTQSTFYTTQKILIGNNKQKKDDNNILSGNTLTFIGHSNNQGMPSQVSDKVSSNEYKIYQYYQQNILQKFNKRRNVILFVDNFELNDDNEKYINQISNIIPTSKSPIIILTNNLSLFTDNSVIGNNIFHTRYSPYLIENEGIYQKENVIYMTFLIMYFLVFIPKANLDKKENKEKNSINKVKENKDKEKEKERNKELENKLDFVISIYDSELSSIDIDNKNYELEKIKKTINNIFVDTKLSSHNNELYSSLITLSNIVAIINNYELDNILVYLKNILDLIEYKLKDQNVIQNINQKILLLQNTILLDIRQYKIQNEFSINSDDNTNEDISKISEICDNNSFFDYEYGSINNSAEKEYENKLENYEINKGVDFNRESYFYLYKYCHDYKYSYNCNCITNEEIEERIIEDHKFYQNYYHNSNIILNKSDIYKFNMILCQIINNDRISLNDISKFIGTRSKRKIIQSQINNSNINLNMYEKISILNKLFRKCPIELFVRYIISHFGFKYYSKFTINENKYSIPEKLLFYNYYNDYYLMEQISSEHDTNYKENEEEEENFEDNDLIDEEEQEEFYEEDE